MNRTLFAIQDATGVAELPLGLDSSDWLAVGSDWGQLFVAVLALAVALATTVKTNRDARRQATFEHLRQIESRLHAIFGESAAALQSSVIAHYESGSDLSASGSRYLSFLTSMDLLGYAVYTGTADANLAREYTFSLLSSPMLSRDFIARFQVCCQSDKALQYAARLVESTISTEGTPDADARLSNVPQTESTVKAPGAQAPPIAVARQESNEATGKAR